MSSLVEYGCMANSHETTLVYYVKVRLVKTATTMYMCICELGTYTHTYMYVHVGMYTYLTDRSHCSS